jgi:ppGpp synthetase/RelA/SpoT-type nucleotidyltranferase
LKCDTSFQARDEGYYAAHVYVNLSVQILTTNWATEGIEAKVELQITTQLQDVIRRMLHTHYEDRRMALQPDATWKWDHTSEEFATNYLGHILHYLEGMIVEIRDRPKKEQS